MDVVRHVVIFLALFWAVYWGTRALNAVWDRYESRPTQKWYWDGKHRTPVAPEDDPEWVEWSKKQGSTGS